MGIVTDFLTKTDWGAPSATLALLALVILVIPAGKKFRTSPMGLLSAVFGAGGFLLAGWIGILTFSIAASYRVFYKLKGKQQFFATVVAGFTLFSVLSFFLTKVDPAAAAERRGSATGSVVEEISTIIADIAGNATRIAVGALLLTAVISLVVLGRRHRKRNPYRRMGLGVDAEQMYRGLVNPNLTPVPEERRDPERSFPAKMRARKLKEQKGYCAYNHLAAHPKWEPYREGIQWEGDHIVPHAVGGATNFVNLQMLCADCNSAKSSKMFREAERAVEERWKSRRAERGR